MRMCIFISSCFCHTLFWWLWSKRLSWVSFSETSWLFSCLLTAPFSSTCAVLKCWSLWSRTEVQLFLQRLLIGCMELSQCCLISVYNGGHMRGHSVVVSAVSVSCSSFLLGRFFIPDLESSSTVLHLFSILFNVHSHCATGEIILLYVPCLCSDKLIFYWHAFWFCMNSFRWFFMMESFSSALHAFLSFYSAFV